VVFSFFGARRRRGGPPFPRIFRRWPATHPFDGPTPGLGGAFAKKKAGSTCNGGRPGHWVGQDFNRRNSCTNPSAPRLHTGKNSGGRFRGGFFLKNSFFPRDAKHGVSNRSIGSNRFGGVEPFRAQWGHCVREANNTDGRQWGGGPGQRVGRARTHQSPYWPRPAGALMAMGHCFGGPGFNPTPRRFLPVIFGGAAPRFAAGGALARTRDWQSVTERLILFFFRAPFPGSALVTPRSGGRAQRHSRMAGPSTGSVRNGRGSEGKGCARQIWGSSLFRGGTPRRFFARGGGWPGRSGGGTVVSFFSRLRRNLF